MDALAQASTDSQPIFKFTNPGDRIHGFIIEEPRLLPVTAFGSDAPKLDAAGRPVMQVMIVLATEQAQDDLHDGRWRVYLDKALLKQAVAAAVRESGADDLLIGDELVIEYTGKTVLSNSREAKAFTVAHSPAGVGTDAGTGAPF
jgi:hypothetical protein